MKSSSVVNFVNESRWQPGSRSFQEWKVGYQQLQAESIGSGLSLGSIRGQMCCVRQSLINETANPANHIGLATRKATSSCGTAGHPYPK